MKTFDKLPGHEPSTPLLDSLETLDALKNFSSSDLSLLADEIREFLLYSTNHSGGHFGAGLGVVELTVALHHVFNTPRDKIVWDVGHQAYPHKILTGRKGKMLSMRQKNGLHPFPSRDESEFDAFGVGHSSTSIGAALGMSVANSTNKYISVIGDGAITAGMAYEAMAHAGSIDKDLLVILNDNNMSISNNTGGMSNYLAKIWSSRWYIQIREGGKSVLRMIPSAKRFAKKTETHIKGFLSPGALFEELGFQYIGPMDGHNLKDLVRTLRNINDLSGPVFLHLVTQKGKGYLPAEKDPIKFHALSKIESSSGKNNGPKYQEVFGEWLCEKAESGDENLVAITPAMSEGSGMTEFAQRFPNQFFDVAIAEQHSMTFAAGLACEGKKPVLAIYSTFLQRAYDQVVHDVAIQSLPVRFAIDRAGLVGADGSTHAGSFDITYLSTLPNFIVMAASDEAELVKMINTSVDINDKPCAIRYPRGNGIGLELPSIDEKIEIGKGRIVQEGNQACILSLGTRLEECKLAAEELKNKGVSTTIIDARFAKPLDQELILKCAREHEVMITIEEGSIGGFGSHVKNLLAETGVFDKGLKFRSMTLPDTFIDQDTPKKMYELAGLSSSQISKKILDILFTKDSIKVVKN